MHAFDIIIVICISCCVGFVPALYVQKDVLLSAGYFVGSVIGAFGGSYLMFWYAPQFDKPGILAGAFGGAILLVVVWHLFMKGRDRDSVDQPG